MSRPDKLILEQESDEGVATLRQIMKLLKMNDSIVRLRIEIESTENIGLSDLPEVEEEEEQQEGEEKPEPKKEKPKFQSKDSHTYRIMKALVDADDGLYLDQLRDALGGPSEAPSGLSSYLYDFAEQGYVHKQKHEHPKRDRKMYRYYSTSKGDMAVDNTE